MITRKRTWADGTGGRESEKRGEQTPETDFIPETILQTERFLKTVQQIEIIQQFSTAFHFTKSALAGLTLFLQYLIISHN